jgi:hypothetical protein
MADKQYYVKVDFEWGVDNGDGTFEMKNDGHARWISMSKPDSIGLQNYAVIPALTEMQTKAGEAGMLAEGITLPNSGKTPPGQAGK